MTALIQSKNKSRAENLLKSLEEKALKAESKGKAKKRKVVEHVEPTDEEFEALQQKLFKKDESGGNPVPNLTATRSRSNRSKKTGF